MDSSKALRTVVKRYLEKTGTTQNDLAYIAGIHPKTLKRFTQGDKPSSLGTRLKIFNVVSDEFTQWEFLVFTIADPDLQELGQHIVNDPELRQKLYKIYNTSP